MIAARYWFLPRGISLSHRIMGCSVIFLKNEASVEVRAIENKQYRLDSAGATFDGRDLFAPSAAWLTKGQSPGSYGRLIYDYVTLPDDSPKMNQQVLEGRIMYIDHFGNAITNITPTEMETFRSVTKNECCRPNGRGFDD